MAHEDTLQTQVFTSSEPIERAAFFPLPGVIKACRSALWGAAGISFVTNLLMLTGPLFMLQIYDRVLASGSVPTLAALSLLVVVLFIFMGLLELVRARLLVLVGVRIDRLLGMSLLQRILAAAPGSSGPAKVQTLRDLDQIRLFAAGPVPPAMFDLPWAVIYFAVLFLFHSLFGVVAVLGAIILVGLSMANEVLSRKPLTDAARFSVANLEFAEAGSRNRETLQSMGMTSVYSARWLLAHRKIVSLHLEASNVATALTVSTRVGRLLLQSIMLATGAYLAIEQSISAGMIVAASIIMSRALSPIEVLIGQWRSVLAVRQGAGRIARALEGARGIGKVTRLPAPLGQLRVTDLYVAPAGTSEIVLKGLQFSIEPGQAMAVVGPSASGKSTLARALVGVWPPRRGDIRLDGAALDQWDSRHLGRHIGYLAQDVVLLEGTVADNIARFELGYDDKQVVEAAKRASVHDLILRLPRGYETRVDAGGTFLSGGQRQRIALARALYGNPALVVLDEPNSNLDVEGEQALCETIAMLRREGKTVVVMAHRASILGVVDTLLVLKEGRQIAFGPRQQVLRDQLANVAPPRVAQAATKSVARAQPKPKNAASR